MQLSYLVNQSVTLAYIATLKDPLIDSEKYALSIVGASVLLAALSDLFRLVTIHVFCFHLYTLRLVFSLNSI